MPRGSTTEPSGRLAASTAGALATTGAGAAATTADGSSEALGSHCAPIESPAVIT